MKADCALVLRQAAPANSAGVALRLRFWLLLSLVSLAAPAAASASIDLLEAVKNGDRETVRHLLSGDVDVTVAWGDGTTALHWAVLHRDLETTKLLIRAGADASAANDHGVTPLSLACTNASTPLVRTLLEASADPDAATSMGETVLMACARAGSADAVSALLAHGASNINARERSRGQTALMWAAAQRHPDVVRVLLANGADVHARSDVSHVLVPTNAYASGQSNREAVEMPMGGFTPLLFAARQGAVESARILLDAGANVNDAAPDGISVLVLAAHSGHTKLVEFLLERGADEDAAEVGYTALHAAVLRGDMGMITALLGHGADPNARLTKGTRVPRDTTHWVLSSYLAGATPFLLAAKYAEPEIMKILVENGADPLLAANDGTTPLMVAAGLTWGWNMEDRRDRAVPNEVVDALHENKARTMEVVTLAVDLAADQAIRLDGSYVNMTNDAGDTALHGATFKGFGAAVDFLIEQGGDMRVKNKRGRSPELCHDDEGNIVRCVTDFGG